MKRWTVALTVLALAGCSGGPGGGDGGDAGRDARSDGFISGDSDVPTDGTGEFDSGDPGTDSGNPGVDSGRVDSGRVDSGRTDSGNPGVDSGRVDSGGTPVDAGNCTSPLTIAITAPAANANVETCVADGQTARYYDFRANITGGTPTQVLFDWYTPPGNQTQPTYVTGGTAPWVVTASGTTYTARRLTGGIAPPSIPLGSFENRETDGWTVRVTAVAANGCRKTVSQTFNLIFTRRDCPAN